MIFIDVIILASFTWFWLFYLTLKHSIRRIHNTCVNVLNNWIKQCEYLDYITYIFTLKSQWKLIYVPGRFFTYYSFKTQIPLWYKVFVLLYKAFVITIFIKAPLKLCLCLKRSPRFVKSSFKIIFILLFKQRLEWIQYAYYMYVQRNLIKRVE